MQRRKSTSKKDGWMKGLKGTIPRKVNMGKLRPVGIPEASIQQQVEAFLQLKGLKYFHCPDAIYQMCAPFSKTPIHVKKIISESLKGLPDLIIFKRKTYKIAGDEIYTKSVGGDYLMIELKKKNSKARQSQVKWHGELPMNVCDSVESAINLIRAWEAEG